MKKNSERLHKKIENHIAALIKSRALKAGDCLPPERVLAKRFRSSHIPVRQAVAALINRDLLEKVPNKGTFVKEPPRGRVRTAKIGVLYHFFDDALFAEPFYAGIFSGINGQAQQAGQSLVLRSFRLKQGRDPAEAFPELHDEVDGFILLDPSAEILGRVGPALRRGDRPVVVLNYEGALAGVDQVVFDSYATTTRLMEFLVALGHRRIGFVYRASSIFNQKTNPNFINRIEAYRAALRGHGLETGAALELHLPAADEREALGRFLSQNPAPTALVCISDQEALRVCRLARELGVDVPGQVTVTGYDGIPAAEMAGPPLTTIVTPLAEMGRRGVQALRDRIDDPARVPSRVVLPGILVERQSHAAIRA
jgi:LacI family transcriptional regulator